MSYESDWKSLRAGYAHRPMRIMPEPGGQSADARYTVLPSRDRLPDDPVNDFKDTLVVIISQRPFEPNFYGEDEDDAVTVEVVSGERSGQRIELRPGEIVAE